MLLHACIPQSVSLYLLPSAGLLAPHPALTLNAEVTLTSFCLGFTVVQLLRSTQLFVTLWTAARQASLSFTNFQSLLKLMSIKLVMPSNHFVLCHPLLLHSTFPSIRVWSNESALCIGWPKY